MKHIVFGDLHGRWSDFHDVLARMGYPTPGEDAIFALTGDFVNKAPDAEQQIILMDFIERFLGHGLYTPLGNHELVLISNYAGNPAANDEAVERMGGKWWLDLKQGQRDRYFKNVLSRLQPHVILLSEGKQYGLCHARPPNYTENGLTKQELADMIGYQGTRHRARVNGFVKYFVGHRKVKVPGPITPTGNVYYMDAYDGPWGYVIEDDVWINAKTEGYVS
jgi:hypothetical protein